MFSVENLMLKGGVRRHIVHELVVERLKTNAELVEERTLWRGNSTWRRFTRFASQALRRFSSALASRSNHQQSQPASSTWCWCFRNSLHFDYRNLSTCCTALRAAACRSILEDSGYKTLHLISYSHRRPPRSSKMTPLTKFNSCGARDIRSRLYHYVMSFSSPGRGVTKIHWRVKAVAMFRENMERMIS